MPKAKFNVNSIEYSQYFDEFPNWLLASTGLLAAVSGCGYTCIYDCRPNAKGNL